MSCIRDNKVCNKCCAVIHIGKNIFSLPVIGGDVKFIRENWKRVSVRLAKKRNPYMFDKKYAPEKVKSLKRNCVFFKCTQLIVKGCAVYEDRPQVCRGFPFYGKDVNDYHNEKSKYRADYSANCTVHYNIPVKLI